MAEILERSKPHKESSTFGGFPLKVFAEINNKGKKLNRLKNQQVFWTHKRKEATGQTTVPKTGETDRRIQGVMVYQSRDSQVETALGTCSGVGKF